MGPLVATMIYAACGKAFGFIGVFLFMAATGLVSACIVPFCVTATGRALGGPRK